MNLFKKIKFFFEYRRIIKKNKARLEGEFNLRIDKVNRMYTVLNLPEDAVIYGKDLSEKYIKKYLSDVDLFSKEIGLSELIGLLNMKQIDKQNYLVVFGYSKFNTAKVANRIIITALLLPIIWILISIFI
jgi:hypothetical protein